MMSAAVYPVSATGHSQILSHGHWHCFYGPGDIERLGAKNCDWDLEVVASLAPHNFVSAYDRFKYGDSFVPRSVDVGLIKVILYSY